MLARTAYRRKRVRAFALIPGQVKSQTPPLQQMSVGGFIWLCSAESNEATVDACLAVLTNLGFEITGACLTGVHGYVGIGGVRRAYLEQSRSHTPGVHLSCRLRRVPPTPTPAI